MLQLLDTIYRYLPPGTLTLILGLLAAMSALPKVSDKLKSGWAHGIAILIFCSIAALEIVVIRHADEVSSAHYDTLYSQSKKAVEGIGLVQESMLAMRLSVDDFKVATEKYSKAKAQTPPTKPPSLKLTALQLSKDIFEFVANYDKSQPVQQTSSSPATDMRDNYMQLVQHFQDARAEYERTFEPRISSVLARAEKELVGMDIKAAKEDCIITGATNLFTIRGCAFEIQRIGEAAK